VADSKQDILDMLRELTELTMLEEGDPQSFRVRAYEGAAQAVAAQSVDLSTLDKKELQKIEGIGKSTADKKASVRVPPTRSASCSRRAAYRSWSC
jgi:DNA polymerase (family X)